MELARFLAFLVVMTIACRAGAPGSAPASLDTDNGAVFVGAFNPTGQSGTDKNVVSIRDAAGNSKTITSEVAFQHPRTGSDKATAIADAINNDDENDDGNGNKICRASATGDTVSIVGHCVTNGSCYRVEKATYTSKTAQGEIRWRNASNGSAPTPADPIPLPTEIAFVSFTGSISGVDPNGSDGWVQVGTSRDFTLQMTSSFSTIENLVDAVVDDLTSKGLDVTKVSSNKLKIKLFSADDHTLIFGGVDTTLAVTGELDDAVH